jgi:hypothetical protein
MDNSQLSVDAPADAQQNLPGAVPEVLDVPVVVSPISTAHEPPARDNVSVPMYSPRSSFVPPDIDVAKLHATESRPMMRDEKSGQLLPYAPTLRRSQRALMYAQYRYPLGMPVDKITDLGPGTQTYLEIVSRFIAFFLLASVICVPSLAIILLSASKQIGSTQNSPLEPLKIFRCIFEAVAFVHII